MSQLKDVEEPDRDNPSTIVTCVRLVVSMSDRAIVLVLLLKESLDFFCLKRGAVGDISKLSNDESDKEDMECMVDRSLE